MPPSLQAKLDSLPTVPGVYQYFAADGELLYVGKAVNLRNRVRSYFHASARLDPKTHRLVSKIEDLEWIVTGSELEALLLEMNLIKEHRPRYNILLKDDKRYPYIKVTWAERFPKVFATRRVLQDGSRYFGPYSSAAAMRETLAALRKVFPYLDCDRTISGRDPRACLYLDIGLCLGPCVGAVDRECYRAMIERLCRFLDGHSAEVLEGLREEMATHAAQLAFERAARVRDRIQAIEQVVERQRIIAPTLSDQDVVAVAREDGAAVAQVFFVRNGKLIGRESFQLAGAGDSPDELLTAFLKQFYDDGAQVPGEIVLPEQILESEIIERWLAERRGTKVRLTVPQRGHKRELVQVAVANAAETLRVLRAAHGAETEDQVAAQALAELRDALGMARLPRRIECYDISTLQGSHTVGSMVVFQNAVALKADYRQFRIKSLDGQDDFAAMAEVLTRRFERLCRHQEALAAGTVEPQAERGSFDQSPDLVLIDGGKGQLGRAREVLQGLGLDAIPLASLAKQREQLFLPGQRDPVILPRDSQALYLVQRCRDEAHRFAISYNRKLRQSSGLRSNLDEAPGIGAKRRRALLVHFGSVDGIRNASVEDLAAVPGMTRRAAEELKAFL